MDDQGRDRDALSARQVMGLVAGNVLEFYDFTIFAFFAPQIGRSMFAQDAGSDGLLAALAAFAVGFLARPFGAFVIGRYADTSGRKPAMVLSFSLMGAALLVIALTPPAAVIGIWSAVVILVARLVQGFALGGEVGPTTALLIEAAPKGRRGLYGAWQIACQGVAILLAGLVGLLITMLLSPQEVIDWGWRMALLLGALVLPVGLYLRRLLPETLERSRIPPGPAQRSSRQFRTTVMLGLLLVLAGTVTSYTLQYVSTYSITILQISPAVAFSATAITGVSLFCSSLLGGHLSDSLGRRKLIIWPRVVLLFAIYPVFMEIIRQPQFAQLALGVFILTSLYGMSTAPANVWIAESFPRSKRSTAYALTYTVAVSVLGGGAQFCITWLMKRFNDVMMPAWWLIGATIAGVLAGTAVAAEHRSPPSPP